MKLPKEPTMRVILAAPERAEEFHDLLTVHHGRKMLKNGPMSHEDAVKLAFELGIICGKRDWTIPVQREYEATSPMMR